MKDTIISFKTAQLAKEVGWKYLTLNFYFEDGESKENVLEQYTGMDYGSIFKIEFSELIENWNDGFLTKKDGNRCFGCSKDKGYLETFSAPTQSLLAKWLREIHSIHLAINFANRNQWFYDIKQIGLTSGKEYLFKSNYEFSTYEEALEEGLYNTLLLIKNKI